MLFPTLHRCRLLQIWAVVFVALIALPITAPFQTISASGLFAEGSHAATGKLSNILLVSSLKDTTVSVVPPLHSKGRFKLQSRSAGQVLVTSFVRLNSVRQSSVQSFSIPDLPLTPLRI